MTRIEGPAIFGAAFAMLGAAVVMAVVVAGATEDFGAGSVAGFVVAIVGAVAAMVGFKKPATVLSLAIAGGLSLLTAIANARGYLLAIPFLVASALFGVALARLARVTSVRP